MTDKKRLEWSDNIEWGNIGDPELLSKSNHELSWTKDRKDTAKKRWTKELKAEQGKLAKRVTKSDKWLEANAEANRLKAKDPVWLENNRKVNPFVNDPEYAREMSRKGIGTPKWREATAIATAIAKAEGKFKKNIEHKLLIAKNKMKSSIMTPYGEYESFLAFKLDYPEIYIIGKGRMKQMPHLYYFTVDGPGEPTYEKVWHSPYGQAGHKHRYRLIELKAIEANDEVYLSYKDKGTWWCHMERDYPDEYFTTKEIKREWD